MSRSPCPTLPRPARNIATRWAPTVSAPQALPEHGVTVVFVDVGNTKIELLEPLGEGSPIAAFLERIRPAACITSATRSTTSSPRATG